MLTKALKAVPAQCIYSIGLVTYFKLLNYLIKEIFTGDLLETADNGRSLYAVPSRWWSYIMPEPEIVP